jgi:acylphosphatase
VIARGHVQGVFFRNSVQRLAGQRDVAGWVRNRPDGSVEAVFEGRPDDVEALVEFCRKGPRGAHVESVEVVAEELRGERGFATA